MPKNSINKKPTTFRGPVATGLAEGSKIDEAGGQYGAGIIPGFAVITRGEALGHGMWVDEVFVGQVSEALSQSSVKSRYTHPDMSSDGLAKGLGRVQFSDSAEKDVVRGDLHFYKSSRKSPDGDLGGHVLSLAKEDPESFGASIVFYHDSASEDEFRNANLESFTYQDGRGNDRDGQRFKSPDALNTNNLPHCRLESLTGCDIVGDPAANPDGLFSRDSTFEEIESFAAYVFGQSEDMPQTEALDVDPERAKSFLSRFLKSKGLALMSTDDPETPEVEAPEVAPTPEVEAPTPAPVEAPAADPKPEGELSAGQKEAKRYVDSFGEKGGVYFAEGLTFEQASAKHIASLNAKVEKQGKEIKSLESASVVPVELGDSPDKPAEKKRGGFASKIEKLNETAE